MTKKRILYDGWILVYAHNSPAALHLRQIIDLVADQIDVLIALPQKPSWTNGTELVTEMENTAESRHAWIQQHLSAIALEQHVAGIHIVGESAPLNCALPVFVSPSSAGDSLPEGIRGRLVAGQREGGLSQSVILWPHDLARFAPKGARLLSPMGTLLPTGGKVPNELDEYSEWILVHGINDFDVLKKIADVWTWAHRPIGNYTPLVMLGLTPEARGYFGFYLAEYEIEESVIFLPELEREQIGAVYEQALVCFHPLVGQPWGDAPRIALMHGVPVVAYEHPLIEAMVGGAGFLLADEHARTLAGGLIAMTTKPAIVEVLQKNARQHIDAWRTLEYRDSLLAIYAELD